MRFYLLLTCLLIGITAFGQLKPRASFDYFIGGYSTKNVKSLSTSTGMVEADALMRYGYFRTRIGAEYTVNRLSLYFDNYLYMNKSINISFRPLQSEWYAGIKFKIYNSIHIKYEHLCIHPVISDGSYELQTRLYGGYDMVSISYGY